MAVNQVSVFFYAPRWKACFTPHPTKRAGGGKPVQVVDAVPVEGTDAETLRVEAVVGWLGDQGFISADWGSGQVFLRGQVHSMFGPEQEIEVSVGVEESEVSDLYCRFTLASQSRPNLGEWSGFVASLCARFGLRLGAEGTAPCGEAEFVAAVLANRNYRDFAESYGWDPNLASP